MCLKYESHFKVISTTKRLTFFIKKKYTDSDTRQQEITSDVPVQWMNSVNCLASNPQCCL